jgi:hypothetical protein
VPAPFVSRTDLSQYRDEDLTTSDKALICVDAACDTVRTITGQTFNLVEDEEIVLDGTGTDALILPQRPVVEVTEVSENDEELVVDDDFKLNGNGILLRMPTASDDYGWIRNTWRCGRGNVAITYSHGYEAEDLPRDIRIVALLIASRLYTQSSEVTFESLGAYSVRYGRMAMDLTPTEKAILYRGNR